VNAKTTTIWCMFGWGSAALFSLICTSMGLNPSSIGIGMIIGSVIAIIGIGWLVPVEMTDRGKARDIDMCPDCGHPKEWHRLDDGGCDKCAHIDLFGRQKEVCQREFPQSIAKTRRL